MGTISSTPSAATNFNTPDVCSYQAHEHDICIIIQEPENFDDFEKQDLQNLDISQVLFQGFHTFE